MCGYRPARGRLLLRAGGDDHTEKGEKMAALLLWAVLLLAADQVRAGLVGLAGGEVSLQGLAAVALLGLIWLWSRF
jgi:hypothetical protein